MASKFDVAPLGHGDWVTVNGRLVRRSVSPRLLLADFLRDELGLDRYPTWAWSTGVCGACSVFIDGRSVRACLTLAVQVDGLRVDTVEGLDQFEEAGRLRRAFSEHGGLQCGFCTPGFLVTVRWSFCVIPTPKSR